MTFDQAQYETLISKIQEGANLAFSALRTEIDGLGKIPGNSGNPDLMKAASNLNAAVQVVDSAMEWANLPPTMYEFSVKWGGIAVKLHNVAIDLQGKIQSSNHFYDGHAAKKHVECVTLQPSAVSEVHGKAMSMSTNCENLVESIFGFYASLGVAIAGLVGIVSPQGLAAFIAGVGNAFRELAFAVQDEKGAFTAVGEAPDNFGYGRWPSSTR